MQKCLYLKKRIKNGQAYCYCTFKRATITFSCCSGCPNKEFKNIAKNALKIENMAYQKTHIRKVSKKRKIVSQKTYNEVYERSKGLCAICGTSQYLEYHHIYFRSERPDLIDDPNNGIMLCGEFANNCHKGKAHRNKRYWQPILLKMVNKER